MVTRAGRLIKGKRRAWPLVRCRWGARGRWAAGRGLRASGTACSARVVGEVTPDGVKVVRMATRIVEEELSDTGAFQYLAILHEDRVTGVRDGKRDFGSQIEVRSWESEDAKTGFPTRLPHELLDRLAERITTEVPGVVSVTYNITKKPPSTIEAV